MSLTLEPADRLRRMGFVKCGDWLLVSEKPKCTLTQYDSAQNVLYAFVSLDTVMYIGKTVQPLKRRMYGYENPGGTQSTNSKGNKLILEFLSKKQPVEVYALPDNGLLYYGGFHVNLAAGLEDSLVDVIKPVWNKVGV
ncbi:GIY-YIG nuclease family protein [Azonexus sp.]|uniref:GIY-YIG nuclease family protein n=1 Tax=Azonexus sp. TaxID=1872668 RepID=UPI00283AB4C9|nr:GIY-YIG nuclease family protein [Azonexus sp.]